MAAFDNRCARSQDSTPSDTSLGCSDYADVFGVDILQHSTQQSLRSVNFNGEPLPPTYASAHLFPSRSFPMIPSAVRRQHATGSEDHCLDDLDVASVAKFGRLFAQRRTRRLIQKSGECSVMNVGVTKRKRKYLADMFTTLVEMRWRYHVILFATQFLVTWCAFGTVYYATAVVHGDVNQVNNDSWVAVRVTRLRLSVGANVFRRDAGHHRVRSPGRQSVLQVCHVHRHAADVCRHVRAGARHWL
jgi:hypothetical protein